MSTPSNPSDDRRAAECLEAFKPLAEVGKKMAQDHTPGPWYSRVVPGGMIRIDNGNCSQRPRGVSAHVVAKVNEVYMCRGEREANGNLLAAAPDLLAACRAAQSVLDHLVRPSGDHAEAFCRAARRKAL
jgi:hypothetical protein